MDRRKTYYIGIDTETCNGRIDVDGKLNLTDSLVYDIGWAVVDKKGNVYESRSFMVEEIFCGMSDLMETCYYNEKLPRYYEELDNGTRKLAPLRLIRWLLVQDMKRYNINIVFAHNARFDYRALNNTLRYLTKSEYRYFFPYGTNIWDTQTMARDTIAKQKTYQAFCFKNGYVTKHKKPRVRLTAEVLYRYITMDTTFIESHTGLEDVLIEKEIFARCMRQHKKMKKSIFKGA